MRIVEVKTEADIPQAIKDTPFAELIRYNNFGAEFKTYEKAQLLVGMCMDNRHQLRLPQNFAYIIRSGGGNLRYSEFKISYAIAIGNVKQVVLMSHNDCGMEGLVSKKDKFVSGLVANAGWEPDKAEEHFMNYAPMFEIENSVEFILSESKRLNEKYPRIEIIPAFYRIDDDTIHLVEE